MQQFDLSTVSECNKILVVGPRASGKTSLVANLVRVLGKNCAVRHIVVNSEAEIGKLLHVRGRATFLGEPACQLDPILLVIDETPNLFVKSRNITVALTNGRYLNIRSILIMQSIELMHPSLRSQFDRIFFFRESRARERSRIFKFVTDDDEDETDFRRLMESEQKPHTCFTVNLCRLPKYIMESYCAKRFKDRNALDWHHFQWVTSKSVVWSKLGKDLIGYLSEFIYDWNF